MRSETVPIPYFVSSFKDQNSLVKYTLDFRCPINYIINRLPGAGSGALKKDAPGQVHYAPADGRKLCRAII